MEWLVVSSDIGTLGGVNLQLVELVLSGSQTGCTNGGDYQQAIVVGGCGPDGQTCRKVHLIFDRNACRRQKLDRAGEQYSACTGTCKNDCGAVADDRSLARTSKLHCVENNSATASNLRSVDRFGDGVTAVFRIKAITLIIDALRYPLQPPRCIQRKISQNPICTGALE